MAFLVVGRTCFGRGKMRSHGHARSPRSLEPETRPSALATQNHAEREIPHGH